MAWPYDDQPKWGTEMIGGNMRPHFVPLSGIVLDRHPISIDFRGRTIEGWYCVENGGVWVHYVNPEGVARRNWADARSNPKAYEVYARIVLRELAEEDIPPRTSSTLLVLAPESSRSQLPALSQRIGALNGVLKVEGDHYLKIEVELGAEERVGEALGAIEELRVPCGVVLICRFVQPKRHRDFPQRSDSIPPHASQTEDAQNDAS